MENVLTAHHGTHKHIHPIEAVVIRVINRFNMKNEMTRQIYISGQVHYITHSEFRDGDEYVILWTRKNGYSLGLIKLKDILK